jgi:hypothetical protein
LPRSGAFLFVLYTIGGFFPVVSAGHTPGNDGRLIVLLPSDVDHTMMTRRIWELARSSGMQVLLLGLCEDRAREPACRRGLVSMASLLEDGKICVEVNVQTGTNWLAIVKSHYQAGDALVCVTNQFAGLSSSPLRHVLEASFNATTYILSSTAPKEEKSNVLSQLIAWTGFIGIMIGFGILQASIVQLPKGGLQSSLLTLPILPEFWLIWLWNGRFG